VNGTCARTCASDELVCGERCVDPANDAKFCGATDCSDETTSGQACGAGEVCREGACDVSCPGAQIVCEGSCVNPNTDRDYCGATACGEDATDGEACDNGEVCAEGACQTSCPGGQIVCDEKCIDPDTNVEFCGASTCEDDATNGEACASGEVCDEGVCKTSCPSDQLVCSSKCIDPDTDREFCGATDCADSSTDGEVCGSGFICADGACTLSCVMGAPICDGACTNPSTDREFCGATTCEDDSTDGVECASGTVCMAGLCTTSCGADQVDCAGSCTDPLTNRAHCGADDTCQGGQVCADGQVCGNGVCVATCPSGTFECSDSCINPLTNSLLCGASDCAGTGGETCGNGQACVQGACVAYVTWQMGVRVDQGTNAADTEQAMATDSAGNALLVFRQRAISNDSESLRVYGSYYSASAGTWSAPTLLDNRAYKVRSLRVDMNDAGVAVAVWIADTASLQSSVVGARFASGSWSAAIDIDGTVIEYPSVYVDNLGQGAVVYSREVDNVFSGADPDWQVYGAIVNTSGTLGTITALSDFSGSAYQASGPRIAGNSAGQGMVTYFSTIAPRNVYAVGYNSATGFAAAATKTILNGALAGDYARGGAPDVALDAAGKTYVVWSQTNANYTPFAATPVFPTRGAIFGNIWNGSSWGGAIQITGSTANTSVDPKVSATLGGVGLTYQRYTAVSAGTSTSTPPTSYEILGHRFVGSSWAAEQLLDASAQSLPQPSPSVAVGGTGDVHFAWADGTSASSIRYSALSGSWNKLENLAAGAGVGAPQWVILAATPTATMFASWAQNTSAQDGNHIWVSRYE